jgi:hypothetical protein
MSAPDIELGPSSSAALTVMPAGLISTPAPSTTLVSPTPPPAAPARRTTRSSAQVHAEAVIEQASSAASEKSRPQRQKVGRARKSAAVTSSEGVLEVVEPDSYVHDIDDLLPEEVQK